MITVLLKKIFFILKNRPSRLLRKDFFLRIRRTIQTTFIYHTLPPSSRKRLYFDLTLLSLFDNRTGVQRVIRSVFEEIQSILSTKYDIVPVCCTAVTKGFFALDAIQVKSKQIYKLTGYKISPQKGDVFLSLEQAFIEHLAQEKTFKDMKTKGCKVILTVYDLLPVQLPYCFPVEVKNIFEKWLLSSASYAEFLCDSRSVEKDLTDFLKSKNCNLINSYWFYPGSNFLKRVSSSGITTTQINYLKNIKNFKFNFLMVGTIEPRKGHEVIFDLFNRLWKQGHKDISLTFVGKEGWMVKKLLTSFVTSKFLNERFFWFNDASDAFLERCYTETDAVIIASLNEGYGLPVLEAAQRNCRVIANEIPVFREVAPENCYFLKLANPELAFLQLQDWLKNPPKRCSLLKQQTWKDSTIQILERTNLL